MSKDNTNDDADLFAKAMAGTNRSHKNYQSERTDDYDARIKPRANAPVRSHIPMPTSEPGLIDQTDQGDDVLFVRSGLQKKVIKKLKRGEFSYESVLDLHGMRIHEAESLLNEFLSESIQYNLSCVLIIHGKGYHSENSKGVLKPYTINWLKQAADIKAFCSAHPRDGGTGAVYVLLKKSATLL